MPSLIPSDRSPAIINIYVVKYVVKDTIKNTSVKDNIKIEDRDVSITVPHELNRADKRILRALEPGVRNPSWLAEQLDYSRQYVHQRLQLLVAAEYVNNLGHGLYELEELPEEVTRDSDTSAESE
jgi:predicted HTH transcriptional regulator